jgi:acyl transferase domain-containing protein
MSGIAVIGLACRVPGARTPEVFWRNLRAGVESITTLSDAQLRAAGVASELLSHPHYVKAAAVLDDIEQFDAALFGFSPREAEILDVQHRLFLECAWQALEDAACDPQRYGGAIGVYAGAGMNAYLLANLIPQREALASAGGFQALISNDKDFLPTRVSYKLNLRGPSVTVQTACSTSLVAVHLACNALLGGECDIALAGGVSVRVPQHAGYLYEEGMILSPDGHCRAFDAQAAGTVPGSGAGIVVLKRLEDALADGDRIDAVVLGSAINNDGALKVGYTAPSVDGQRAVISEALAVAGVDPASIGYVEAHGTGTPLGDPIEVAALTQAFAGSDLVPGSCVLGALKTNVGHLDTAAGVAGFIKAVLALKHREIPPTLHFTAANPQLDLARSPFRVSARVEAWPAGDKPARAGVSSFGIGGTNAHVILEEAPPVEARPAARLITPLVLSARSEAALDAHARAVGQALADAPETDLADATWSLQNGRHAFAYRLAVTAPGTDAASATLLRGDGDRDVARARSVVFMFPGQGAQTPGMAAGLYGVAPEFRAIVDACCARLGSFGGELRALLRAEAVTPEASARLTQTAVAQPALFIVEYALAQQLRAWGLTPAGLIGHSLGEFVAACVAGTLTMEDALALVVERGRLMQQLPGGRMVAVRATPDETAALLPDGVTIAAINAPGLCVASGPPEAVAALERLCASRGIECHDLHTSHAFHSPSMDPVLSAFGAAVARVTLTPPSTPWISNVTGTWISAADAVDPAYWVRHLRHAVLFSAGVACARQLPHPVLLEVGPGRTLGTLALAAAPEPDIEATRGQPAAGDAIVLPTLTHARERARDQDVLMRTLGRLWAAGVEIAWDAIDTGRERRRLALPTYPFERQRYWVEPPVPGSSAAAGSANAGTAGDRHAVPTVDDGVTKRPLDEWFHVPVWKSAPAPARAADATTETAGETWLVCALDGETVAAGLLARLRRDGAEPVLVTPGAAFLRRGDRQYALRPGCREDYDALIAELRRVGQVPTRVLHAWSVDSPDANDRDALECGFLSVTWLARALADVEGEIRIDVLSSRMQAVPGDPRLVPLRAAVAGPVLVVPKELPAIRCRSIDYDGASVHAGDALVDRLYRELRSAADTPWVAYRNHQRLERTLERVALPDVSPATSLRTGGHYLVTGGLGGVGLVIAAHLAANCGARLSLLGRTPFPARDTWPAALAGGTGSTVAGQIRQIQAIEAAGGQVCMLAADVGDLDALRTAVREAEQRFGPVHGVIHAAGVPAGGMLQRKTREDIEAVLRPKVQGALNLLRVFDSTDLDVMVFVSSLTGILGDAGQVDYCAAGAVLDALAHEQRASGKRVVSIDWDTWQEAGMAVDVRLPGALQRLREESLRSGIRNAEAVAVLARVLASDLTQVVVSTRDPVARARRDADVAAQAVTEIDRRGPGHARPALAVAFAPPGTPQEEALCRIWQTLLGIAEVGIHDDFFELGGHSLLATQVLSRVRDQLGVRVTLTTFFETPTIGALGAAVARQQLEAVLADVGDLTDEEAALLLAAADDDKTGETA